MKLSDIDKSLNEAPVGKLGRLANKLKKNMPFNKDMRDEAAGEEVTQLAANELWSSFNTWLGKVKASGVNPNAITGEQLIKFFRGEGFEKTAIEVIRAAQAKKAGGKLNQDDDKKNDDSEQSKKQTGVDFTDQASAHLDKMKAQQPKKNEIDYGTFQVQSASYEERLALMLFEEEGIPLPTFNKKEVEKLILKIVASVHDENPDGLAQRVNKYVHGQDDEATASPTPSAGATMSDDEFGRLSGLLDDFFLNFEQSMKKLNIDADAQKKLKAAWEHDKENTLWDMKKQS